MKNIKTQQMVEEELEILTNRLATSTYDEDKIETLESILEISKTNPIAVGTISIKATFLSIADMENVDLQIKILGNIVRTELRNEFIEILFNEDSNLAIIFQRPENEAFRLLEIFNTDFINKKISNDPLFSLLLIKVFSKGFYLDIQSYVEYNCSLKEKLAFDGMLEVLFTYFSRERDQKKKHKYLRSIILLLNDSIVNQSYLLHSDLIRFVMADINFQIFEILLNPCNSEIEAIKNTFFIPRILHRAVETEQYSFLWKVSMESPEKILMLFKKYINMDLLLDATDNNIDSLKLLEAYIEITGVPVFGSSYRTCMVLSHLGVSCTALQDKVLSDFMASKISVDMLLYIILVFPDIESISSYLKIDQYDGTYYYLVLILNLMHGNDVCLTRSKIKKDLSFFRAEICKNPIFLDWFNEMIIELVGDLISKHVFKYERIEIFKQEIPKENTNKLPNIVENQEKNNFVKDGKQLIEKNIGSVIGFIKSKVKQEPKNSFDL